MDKVNDFYDRNSNVTDLKDHWAVLVAGSNGYFNYRHQADMCHAYQIAIKNETPADAITTIQKYLFS